MTPNEPAMDAADKMLRLMLGPWIALIMFFVGQMHRHHHRNA